MKKKRIFIIAGGAVVIAAAVILIIVFFIKPGNKQTYQYAKIAVGDIKNTVTCTGTLQFTESLNVPALTSGVVDKWYVDFNQKVKKGQLLATLEPTINKLAFDSAAVALQKAVTLFNTAVKNLADTKDLFAKNYKSQDDLNTAQDSYDSAKQAVDSAKIDLEKARVNLEYMRIVSPVLGVVVQRNIDVGQSVTAGSATPLFVVASDTKLMQVLASVDESDISQVKPTQDVSFSVQAYQDNKFNGKVSQIRLNPTVVSNVVNYTVVVDADNKDGLLLPGMTATLDIIIQQKSKILRAPAAVLKFQATPEMFRLAFAGRTRDGSQNGGGGQNGSGNRGQGGQNGSGFNQNQQTGAKRTNAMLWVLDETTGKVSPVRVKLGVTDGSWTEIISDSIKDGTQVVSGLATKQAAQSQTNSAARSPFQPQGGGGFRGPGR